jgi:hypothetical protein
MTIFIAIFITYTLLFGFLWNNKSSRDGIDSFPKRGGQSEPVLAATKRTKPQNRAIRVALGSAAADRHLRSTGIHHG